MPRRPSSQDGKDGKKSKAKPKNSEEASPPPPEDPDERLIFDAYKTAFSHVNSIVNLFNFGRVIGHIHAHRKINKSFNKQQISAETALCVDEATAVPGSIDEPVIKGKPTAKPTTKAGKSRSPSAKGKGGSPKGKKGKGTKDELATTPGII